jgi:formate hydrogenlyase subunit 6/NADH:ubiquinone oxidoreductase subunit I
VKKIVSPEGRIVKEFGREPVRNVISQETAPLHARYDGNEQLRRRNCMACSLPNG